MGFVVDFWLDGVRCRLSELCNGCCCIIVFLLTEWRV
jgi:hypothetical protein